MTTKSDLDHLTNVLATNFGLGREARSAHFTEGVLCHPCYINPKKRIKPNINYAPPTPHDIALLKSKLSMSTGQLARWLLIDNRNLNALISATGYEKGNRMSTAQWCQLCEASGLTDRLIIRPIYADIREEVLETTEILPTKHELYLLFSLSGMLIEDIAALTGISLSTLKTNCLRGSTAVDENLNYVNTDENELTKIHSTSVKLTISEWHKIRDSLSINESYTRTPPKIRNCVFGLQHEGFSPYSQVRNKHKGNESGNTTTGTEEQLSVAEINYNHLTNGQPVYIPAKQPDAMNYSPPTPLELRSILCWTGYSLGELAMLLGMTPKDVAFLQSKNAINHSALHPKSKKPLPPKTKYISFAQWRRLCEVFNLCEPRRLITTSEIE